MDKRGGILNQVLIHIILIGLIFAIFLFATAEKVNSRDVKQQVLEKQIALLVDSAEPGMSFGVRKNNINGIVSAVEARGGRVFVTVDGIVSLSGYPYFSSNSISVTESEDKFWVNVR